MNFFNSITGLHHASSKYHVDGKNEGFTARLLFLRTPNGDIETFWRLFDYIIENSRKSPSWQDHLVRAIGLFWDYYVAVYHFHSSKNIFEKHRHLISGFIDALLTGTYRTDGNDQMGLYWPKFSFKTVKSYVRNIDQFIAWNQKVGDFDSSKAQLVFDGCTSNQFLLNLAVARKKNLSLLGHLIDKSKTGKKINYISEPDPYGYNIKPVNYFPPKFYEKLIFYGYKLRGTNHSQYGPINKYNIRNMMLSLLQACGGCRESECFHLYTFDVMEDPNKPDHSKVLLYHPSDSKIKTKCKVTGNIVTVEKADFLKQEYSLIPRHWAHSGGYRAGWKNLKLNRNGYAEIFWIDDNASKLFWLLYKIYIIKIRGPIMQRRRILGGRDHPFLFVSEKGKPGDNGLAKLPGAPYTISQYEKSHKRAVLKIGLPHDKKHGTTSHGLRHLYVHLLLKMNIPLKLIQECLHHRSFFSQAVYTVPDPETINQVMQSAGKVIETGDYIKILDKSYTEEWMKSQFNFDPERPFI